MCWFADCVIIGNISILHTNMRKLNKRQPRSSLHLSWRQAAMSKEDHIIL